MIIGVGNDLIEIARVKEIMEGKLGDRFLQRILTSEENRLARERQGKAFEFTAGRFAAKEAIVKALGCGIGEQIGFQDIEILPDAKGKPICSLSVSGLTCLGLELQTIKIHISISHSKTMASAVAIIESV